MRSRKIAAEPPAVTVAVRTGQTEAIAGPREPAASYDAMFVHVNYGTGTPVTWVTWRLLITGYRAAPAVSVRSYGAASHGIGRSRASAGGVVRLAPSSLTELALRPAGTR